MLGLLVLFMIDPFGVAMDPEVSSSLALEQLENPSLATDTALRSRWAILASNPFLWVGVGATVVFFWKDFATFLKGMFK